MAERNEIQRGRRWFLKGAVSGGLAAVLGVRFGHALGQTTTEDKTMIDTILMNGRITTLDRTRLQASAVAIRDGLFEAVGSDEQIMRLRAESTQIIDLNKQTVIPGLNDSHTHVIRGGLHYNMELRWEGVPSLADALRMLKAQAARTPAPQWVRVVGGWSEFQFAERRMPTLSEINAAAPDTPVFVLHLYDRALLNAAALHAVGITKDSPDPPGGVIRRDRSGNPTGMLVAQPNALILYSRRRNQEPSIRSDDGRRQNRPWRRQLQGACPFPATGESRLVAGADFWRALSSRGPAGGATRRASAPLCRA
ncbi:MAG: amidohydrolase family protein [Desulfosarcina sp.]